MTTQSNEAMNELNEPIRKLGKTFTRRESRHQSRANPFLRASVFLMGLMMVVFFMDFDLVSTAPAQEVEETKPQSTDNDKPKDVLLIPLQQVMGAMGALKQQEYHDARTALIETCRHQDEVTPECMNTCQQVKKVEKVWDAVVVKTCKCYTSPNSSFACQITCDKMCNCDKPQAEWNPSAACQTLCSKKEAEKKEVPEGINTVDKSTEELFCPEASETERRLNGLVFSTYLLWDMSKAVEEVTTLTHSMNMIMGKMAEMPVGQAELGAVLSLAQNTYLNAREYLKTNCHQFPKNPQCQQYTRLVNEVDEVIATVVCQQYPDTAKCPQPDIETLIQACQSGDHKSCKINVPRVFSTYLLWEAITGLHLAVSGLENLGNMLAGVRTALRELEKMVSVMGLMNRNMEMMRHDMGIMRHDMDSTMGRAGRAMPWMPWGW